VDVCVCGAQVPFVRGGAEQHMENLLSALREAGHRAELVRLPTAWDRARVFDAALAWRMVPLDADVVIATNFPSYFVRHPRKVVWLFHQHRSFYDAAGTAWSDIGDDDESREAQRLLATWDRVALGEAVRLFATSGVVAARLLRSTGLVAEPLAHPPPLHERLRPGPFGDEVFCATRLEANKRPGLMVDAFAHVRAPVRLTIAGRGSLAGALAEQVAAAGLTDRVTLTGHIDDAELVERFARALAVLYVPHDEDYGYVTLQAFRAGKPVITTADAGGVLEWVTDGVTGLVTDGTPAGIAEAVDRLAADRDLARKLGEAGAERVAELSWAPVVERLLAR
jgi:glycosyltransferase involved in cell wall biosynthesis